MANLDQLLQHNEYAEDIAELSPRFPTLIYGLLYDTQNLMIFLESADGSLHIELYTPAQPPLIMRDLEVRMADKRRNIRFSPSEERYTTSPQYLPLTNTSLKMLYSWKTTTDMILGDTSQRTETERVMKFQHKLFFFERLSEL